jgi:hypothetical protein
MIASSRREQGGSLDAVVEEDQQLGADLLTDGGVAELESEELETMRESGRGEGGRHL